MRRQTFMCEKCSGPKRIVFEKPRLDLLLIAIIALVSLWASIFISAEKLWHEIVIYGGTVLLISLIGSSIRVRCFRCETEGKSKN